MNQSRETPGDLPAPAARLNAHTGQGSGGCNHVSIIVDCDNHIKPVVDMLSRHVRIHAFATTIAASMVMLIMLVIGAFTPAIDPCSKAGLQEFFRSHHDI